MTLRLRIPAACMIASLAGCAASAPPTAGQAQWTEETYVGEAGALRYRLYLPPSEGAPGPRPLLIMLHGCTQDPEDFTAGTRMNTRAAEQGWIVAYPEQPASAHPQKCWNWYDARHQARGGGEPALIAGITREVMEDYDVDPRRVYVAGVSAGGAMSVILGATYPELFAAVGSHSGIGFRAATNMNEAMSAMQGSGPDPATQGEAAFRAMGARVRIVPLIVFQGGADPVVRPANAEQLVAQWQTTLERAGATLGEGEEAGPGLTTGDPLAGYNVARTLYRDENGNVLIESWIVDGLGHAWSGGSPEGSYTDPRGPDASREMLRFFRKHPREER